MDDIITWDRFSAAPEPLEMQLQLGRVWHVRADPSYDVRPGPREPLPGRVIRTLEGEGTLILREGQRINARGGTVVYLPYREIRRYQCTGDVWHFWWFECAWPEGDNTPRRPVTVEPAADEANLLRQLWNALPHPAPERRAEAVGTFAHLLCHWFSGRAGPAATSPSTEDRIAAVLAEIPNRIGPAVWTVENMARHARMSSRAFREHFTRITGRSPKNYYDQQRLQLAAHQLRTTNLTLEALAEQLGYSSPFHLSKAFKNHFGRSPREHRSRASN